MPINARMWGAIVIAVVVLILIAFAVSSCGPTVVAHRTVVVPRTVVRTVAPPPKRCFFHCSSPRTTPRRGLLSHFRKPALKTRKS